VGLLEQRRKLARLEARAAATRSALVELAEVRRERAISEAVALLEDADLRTLGSIIDAAIEDLEDAEDGGAAHEGYVDLYRYASDARDVSALRALACALANA
jgi:hypothetical protein